MISFPLDICSLNFSVKAKLMAHGIQKAHPLPVEGFVGLSANGRYYDKPGAAGAALLTYYRGDTAGAIECEYRGFKLKAERNFIKLYIGDTGYNVDLFAIDTGVGVISRLNSLIDKLPKMLEQTQSELVTLESNLKHSKQEYGKPFVRMDELVKSEKELQKITEQLNQSETEDDIALYATEVYETVVSARPDLFPADKHRDEVINGLVQTIRAGNSAQITKLLNNAARYANYATRDAINGIKKVYEQKADVWALDAPATTGAVPEALKVTHAPCI